jgi:hemerythrin HHE cation binding domain-containing protein
MSLHQAAWFQQLLVPKQPIQKGTRIAQYSGAGCALMFIEEDTRMNAVELLKADHQKTRELMDQIEIVDDRAGAVVVDADSFEELKEALRLHTETEEKIFYPAIESSDEARSLLWEAYRAHRAIDHLLMRLSTEPSTRTGSHERLAALKASVEYHFEQQDAHLFCKAQELLGRRKLEELGRKMEEMRHDLAA